MIDETIMALLIHKYSYCKHVKKKKESAAFKAPRSIFLGKKMADEI